MNKQINVAHEAPVSIMDQVQMVTDYDYALSVCFDKVDGYYDFFERAKKKKRWVLLDNGIFEEGVAMEPSLYADWIAKLLPNEFIVPDVLENGPVTMANFDSWLTNYGDLPGRRIGVAQGKTLAEFVECYKYMSSKADKIAISFDYSLYLNDIMPQNPPRNKWNGYVRGRLFVLEYLYGLGILNQNKPHHLLGAALPSEFGHYSRINAFKGVIDSIDTSNPVVYAIMAGKYPKNIGEVDEKISKKLKDLITTPRTDKLLVDAIANITQFRTQNQL